MVTSLVIASLMERIALGELSVAYERAGTGPPLVLLHGGLSDHREWRRQIDSLSDTYTVVAWDAPGCGASDDPPATYRMPDYAGRLADLIDGLGLGRPHVLGLSWGSTLGLALYQLRPRAPARADPRQRVCGLGRFPDARGGRRSSAVIADRPGDSRVP